MLSGLSALGTFAASLPAWTLLARPSYALTYRLLCLAVGLLGLAKLCRFRPLADNHVDPWLYSLTGVYNLPIALAATCAVVAYSALLLAAVTSPRSRRTVVVTIALTLVVFWTCFALGYGGQATGGRPSTQGVDNAAQTLSWALPLVILTAVNLSIIIACTRALRRRNSAAGIGVPHALLAAGIGGLIYGLNKVFTVGLSTLSAPTVIIDTVTIIGLISLPSSAIVLAIVVYSAPLTDLLNRLWRYRRLRDTIGSLSRAEAWSISRDAQQTHETLIDAADKSITSVDVPGKAN